MTTATLHQLKWMDYRAKSILHLWSITSYISSGLLIWHPFTFSGPHFHQSNQYHLLCFTGGQVSLERKQVNIYLTVISEGLLVHKNQIYTFNNILYFNSFSWFRCQAVYRILLWICPTRCNAGSFPGERENFQLVYEPIPI